MKSITDTPRSTLAPVSLARAKQFLSELANLREEGLAKERFKKRFAELLPPESEMPSLLEEFHQAVIPTEPGTESLVRVTADVKQPISSFDLDSVARVTGKPLSRFVLINRPPEGGLTDWWLDWVRALLRMIWDTPDVGRREFMVLRLLRMDSASVLWLLRPGSDALPSPLMQVFRHLFKLADRMRHCGNTDCVAPYFFATRRSQKYCSDACSIPSQREFKRRWWAEHGEARRNARKRASNKSQRKRGT